MSTVIMSPETFPLDTQGRHYMFLEAWKTNDCSIVEITKMLRWTNDFVAVLQEDELISVSDYSLWVLNKHKKCFLGDTFFRHVSIGGGWNKCRISLKMHWKLCGMWKLCVSIGNSAVMCWQDALHRQSDKIRYNCDPKAFHGKFESGSNIPSNIF